MTIYTFTRTEIGTLQGICPKNMEEYGANLKKALESHYKEITGFYYEDIHLCSNKDNPYLLQQMSGFIRGYLAAIQGV